MMVPQKGLLEGLVRLAIICTLALAGCSPSDSRNGSEATSMGNVQPGSVNQQAITNLLADSPWSYSAENDGMTSRQVVYATTISTNSVDFGDPYSGGSTLEIALRKHPRVGTDAIIKISKGQTHCDIEGCGIAVRFDKGPVRRFSAISPTDGSSEALFITPTSSFISGLRHAKTATIEVEFFQEGRRQFSFNTRGLHWPPEKADL